MTAGVALFLLDAFALAIFWPVTLRLAQDGGLSQLQIAMFALVQLGMLYALGLYRRECVAELDKAYRRIPMVTALSLAASSFATAALGWTNSIGFCVAAGLCFAGCAVVARAIFAQLRRHSMFRSRLLVIGAGERAWDLLQILRGQEQMIEVQRILKAFVDAQWLGEFDARLAAYRTQLAGLRDEE